jgi:hypothetical protein
MGRPGARARAQNPRWDPGTGSIPVPGNLKSGTGTGERPRFWQIGDGGGGPSPDKAGTGTEIWDLGSGIGVSAPSGCQ